MLAAARQERDAALAEQARVLAASQASLAQPHLRVALDVHERL